ncbi:MAG TPA: hypothetical protein PLQ85_04935 [Anaerolineae bacterium]|nr:hypothetical protein [Anaerolineae bacterium]
MLSTFADQLRTYVAAHTIDDAGCLRWTGWSVNGHPGGTIGGRKLLIRRALFEVEHGEPVPAGKVLRCTCGTPLCVVLSHCGLTTYQRIAVACGAQGLMSGPVRSAHIAAAKRAGPQAKIDQEQALAIRASDEPGVVLAARHGISPATVSKIRRGLVRRDFVGNPWAALMPHSQGHA